MGYRIPDPPDAFDSTTGSTDISVDNGTVSRFAIVCMQAEYGICPVFAPFPHDHYLRFHHNGPRHARHAGWKGYRSEPEPADMEWAGYTAAELALESQPDGLQFEVSLDRDTIYLRITASCPDAEDSDLEIGYAIYLVGETEEDGALRDVAAKGKLRIAAGQI